MIHVAISDSDRGSIIERDCSHFLATMGGIPPEQNKGSDAQSIYIGPDNEVWHSVRLMQAMKTFIQTRGLAAFKRAVSLTIEAKDDAPDWQERIVVEK